MTDKIELKPCPFCGGKAYFLHGRKNECITCEECGHRFYSLEIGEDAQKELWKQWNRRPIEDELRKDLRYYRNYCAALEKEVKSLRNEIDQIRITLEAKKDGIVPTRFNLDSVDGRVMLSIVEKALKAK